MKYLVDCSYLYFFERDNSDLKNCLNCLNLALESYDYTNISTKALMVYSTIKLKSLAYFKTRIYFYSEIHFALPLREIFNIKIYRDNFFAEKNSYYTIA